MDRRRFLATMAGLAAATVVGSSTASASVLQQPRGVRIPRMKVGGSMNVYGNHDPTSLETAMGLPSDRQLDFFRCYDTDGPAASWAGIDQRRFVGQRPLWWSCKGDIRTWASGGFDANAIALAKSYDPTWPKIKWTIWHEVQPKLVSRTFTFAEYKAAWTHFYNTVKPYAPPNMKLGIIHGGYAWRPGQPETTYSGTYTASPDEWRALPSDFQGIDCYGGPTADDIVDMPRFQRFVMEMCAGDPRKCHIAESGVRQSLLTSDETVEWIHRNGDRLAALDVGTWCYWNSTMTSDPGPLDTAGMSAWGDVWRKWSPNR